MQVILDSSFARPGSAPIWGGKKGEFRDWTMMRPDVPQWKSNMAAVFYARGGEGGSGGGDGTPL